MSLYQDNGPAMTMPVAPAYGGGYGGMGGFGDGGWWGILFLIALFCGGWGGFGGFGGMGMMGMWPWMFGGFGGWGGNGCNGNAATPADVQRGFDQQTLISKIDQQTYGLAQSTYDLNNTMQNGFSSAELSRCNQQAALMQMLYQISTNQKDCCCQTKQDISQVNYDAAMRSSETNRLMERGFCDTNYNAATNTTAIIQNAHNDTDRVLARLDAMERNQDKDTIANLRAQLAACGDQSTANYIINQVRGIVSPTPVPAYPAASPCGLGNWSPAVLANGYGYNGGCCGFGNG